FTFGEIRLGEDGIKALKDQLLSADPHEVGAFPDITFDVEVGKKGLLTFTFEPGVTVGLRTGAWRPGLVTVHRFFDAKTCDYRITTYREIGGVMVRTESKIVPYPG